MTAKSAQETAVPLRETFPARQPPHIPGLPYFGAIYRMHGDPLAFLTEASRKGDVVLLGRLGGKRYFLVNDLDLIEEVFLNPGERFDMTRDSDVLRALFSDSIFMRRGATWLQRRRLLQPAFSHRQLPVLAEGMTGPIRSLLCRWRDPASANRIRNIERDMMDVVQQMMTTAMFGVGIREDVSLLRSVFEIGMTYRQDRRWSLFTLPMNLPTPRNRRFHAALEDLNRVMRSVVQDYREGCVDPACAADSQLITVLMAARDPETGASLTDSEVVEEVKTIFNTGFVTTAVAATWVLYMLMRMPAVQAKLREEVRAQMAGEVPTYEETAQLRYTMRVIQETMRLYPPGWMTTRRVRNDTLLGGFRLPAGATLIMSQYTTHRHPAFWERPEEFDPSRFEGNPASTEGRMAYFPFGAGLRRCIGESIALMELLLIIAAIVRNFDLQVISEAEVSPWPLSVLKPRQPISARIEPVPFFAGEKSNEPSHR